MSVPIDKPHADEYVTDAKVTALQKLNERLLVAQKIASLAYWELDLINHQYYWSDELFDMFGLTNTGQLIDQNFYTDLVHPDDREAVIQHQQTTIEQGKLLHNTFRVINKHGKTKYFLVRGKLITANDGGGIRIEATTQDITDLKKAEEGNRFKAELLNTIGQAVIATDLDGIICFWNQAAEDMYGWTAREAMDKKLIDLIPSNQTKEEAVEIIKVISKGRTWSGEFMVRRKDATTFPIFVTDAPIYDRRQKLSGIIGVSTDITERKKAEIDLTGLTNQLRDLSSHLQNIREEERMQIARDIHDDLGQQLTGLKMEISLLLKKLNIQDETIKPRTASIINLIDETINSVRKISSNLRPSILDDFGLIAALEWHSEEVESQTTLKVSFEANIDELDLPVATSTAIFRIYQEALTNVIRHANAHRVTASLNIVDNHLILEISDDGRGTDASIKNNKKTLGLIGIKERTFIIGGQYQFDSQVGKGTKIRISIPI